MKPFTVRLPLELYTLLSERAKHEHRTLSNLIIHLLTVALQEQPK